MADLNNLAYDYSAYDEEEVLRPSTKIKHRKNIKSKKTSGAKVILLVVITVALLGAMIFGKVELAGEYSKQSELETQLQQLTNENLSFESELAQKTGLTKVEEYAEGELGLKKLDKSQIEYVEVEETTVAQVVATEETNVFVKIKRLFSDVLEYIGA